MTPRRPDGTISHVCPPCRECGEPPRLYGGTAVLRHLPGCTADPDSHDAPAGHTSDVAVLVCNALRLDQLLPQWTAGHGRPDGPTTAEQHAAVSALHDIAEMTTALDRLSTALLEQLAAHTLTPVPAG